MPHPCVAVKFLKVPCVGSLCLKQGMQEQKQFCCLVLRLCSIGFLSTAIPSSANIVPGSGVHVALHTSCASHK